MIAKVVVAALLTIVANSSAQAAERILALSPHSCELLGAIGAEQEVVGVSEYCDFPTTLADRPVVANHSRLFSEAALKLKPTLATVSNPALKMLPVLEKHGVQLLVTHPKTVEEIFDDLLRLGEATGHSAQAQQLVGSLRKQLEAIKKSTKQRRRIFFEVWSNPLMTEAGRSFITEALKAAGGDNIFAGERQETMRLSIEAVVRAKPEVIIIPEGSSDIESRRKFWKKWLPEAAIITINPDLISRPGPRIIKGIALLQQKLGSMP